jgi:hypothetical protein
MMKSSLFVPFATEAEQRPTVKPALVASDARVMVTALLAR